MYTGTAPFPGFVEVDRSTKGVIVATLHGEHDHTTANDLGQLLEALTADGAPLVIDFSNARHFDMSTLHTLVVIDKLAHERGVRLVVKLDAASDSESVCRIVCRIALLDGFANAATRNGAIQLAIGAIATPGDHLRRRSGSTALRFDDGAVPSQGIALLRGSSSAIATARKKA